jgi:type IV pilus assembly protein PilY1
VKKFLLNIAGLTTLFFTVALANASDLSLATRPLYTGTSEAPMTMLVMGRDHTLYYEAYNDAADLDDDGRIDTKFIPGNAYEGYFDPDKCYGYADNLFTPERKAVAVTRACTEAAEWSGNFLNYLTMTRMDVLRKVLYGGYRSTDDATETILERVYIPRDGHSWAKAYKADDGYDIADYAPYIKPTGGKQHFFGSVTYESNAHKADDQTDSPSLQVIINAENVRNLADWGVWNWASTERPVLNMDKNKVNNEGMSSLLDLADDGNVEEENYTVRVKVCVPGTNLSLLENNCKAYVDGTTTTYKPTGLLHDYGDNNQMLFGLLTGSYNKNLSGGVLRKAISQFSQEIVASTGVFKTGTDGIVATINKLRINGFDYNDNNQYAPNWSGKFTQSLIQGKYTDWGNPIGEMLYEAMRYFSGVSAASETYATSGGVDADLDLPTPAWDDPYDGRGTCAQPNVLLISDINPSYDSDQLPGAYSEFAETYTGSVLPDFDITDLLSTISGTENISGQYFIGQSGSTTDGAPTAKEITGLGSVRGLAPAEPTKKGSYTSAGVAYYGLKNDIHTSKAETQNVRTMVVSLASNLPEIEVKFTVNETERTIKIVPFAKSVGGNSINATSGNFQPTNTIVDWYVESQSATQGTFRINFEDVEQGNDHDMDMVVKYTYEVKDLCFAYKENDPTKACETYKKGVEISLDSTYAAGGIDQHAGYIISGTTSNTLNKTTDDGLYLEVKDQHGGKVEYYLDTPDSSRYENRAASGSHADLPFIATRNFFPSETPAASFLPSPLWYAAKWGGFVDGNKNGLPDGASGSIVSEWDANDDGLPDTYFPVTNAGQLKAQLAKAFDLATDELFASTAPVFSSRFLVDGTKVYESSFEEKTWSGDIKAFQADGNGVYPTTPTWSAATELAGMALSTRKIFTRRNDSSGTVFEFTTPSSLTVSASSFTTTQLTSLLAGTTGTDAEKLTYLQAVIDYIRGDRTNELDDNAIESDENASKFRKRNSRLGDIINSTPYYVANANGHDVEKDVLVFGANDGMVHVLDAANGKELVAYIPSGVYDTLGKVVNQTYNHEYSVDGGISAYTVPAVGSVTAKTTLVGTLGLGVQGLYALDVSDMTIPTSSMMEWEITTSTTGYAGIGYITASPTIVKLANTDVGVIFSNGYNSSDPDGAIYIADITDGTLIKKLTVGAQTDPTGAGRSNALAQPAIIDNDGDGDADYIYAGDLFGNMWVFDISGTDETTWGITTTNSKPLFTAYSPTKNDATEYIRQPITTRPSVVRHPSGTGVLVAFGTGKYVENIVDVITTNQATQSFYVIADKLDNAVVTNVRGTDGAYTDLQSQTIEKQTTSKRQLSTNAVNWSTKKGFYIDLINKTVTSNTDNKGERQVSNSVLFANKVSFITLIPDADPCNAGGTGWYMELNLYTGQTWNIGIALVDDPNTPVDESDDIAADSSNTLVDGVATGMNTVISDKTEITTDNPDGTTTTVVTAAGLKTCFRLTTGKVVCFDDDLTSTGRLSWRHLY